MTRVGAGRTMSTRYTSSTALSAPRAATMRLVSVLLPCWRWEACRTTAPTEATIVAGRTHRVTGSPCHAFSAVDTAGRTAEGSGTPATPYHSVANMITSRARALVALTNAPTRMRGGRAGGLPASSPADGDCSSFIAVAISAPRYWIQIGRAH